MPLYADENFPLPVVEERRRLGLDVMTTQEDGRHATPDPDLLARTHALGRAILTRNRRHFVALHRQGADHRAVYGCSCRWVVGRLSRAVRSGSGGGRLSRAVPRQRLHRLP
jgi:hypothetical protein